ncbi:hypothetical protein [Luteimonas aquatica]|uniref:hypothetical protein n=1 Tax=Luteimonas aquatica TaxID=450364 RepID=UPI001F568BF8|nr:hypothetical protein [Luteimonas aquatica]
MKIGQGFKFGLAAAILLVGAMSALGSSAQSSYVDVVYYYKGGTLIGVRYVSHGCRDPQPPGWGTTSLNYTVSQSQCFMIAGPGMIE